MRSKSPKVPELQGPKDQDISKSHSNTSLTLKKVHLVYLIFLLATTQYIRSNQSRHSDLS